MPREWLIRSARARNVLFVIGVPAEYVWQCGMFHVINTTYLRKEQQSIDNDNDLSFEIAYRKIVFAQIERHRRR